MARYKRTTGTLGHRYNNKHMQLKHAILMNNITTLVKRWPNVVDDSVGPTLAGRWPNGDTSPLGQRKGSWPKQRWANGWCQRWPNQCASVGPTLVQPNIAIWGASRQSGAKACFRPSVTFSPVIAADKCHYLFSAPLNNFPGIWATVLFLICTRYHSPNYNYAMLQVWIYCKS